MSMCHVLCRREMKPYNHKVFLQAQWRFKRGNPRSPDTQAQPSLLIHMARDVVPFWHLAFVPLNQELRLLGCQHSVYSKHFFADSKLGQKLRSCLYSQTRPNAIFFFQMIF